MDRRKKHEKQKASTALVPGGSGAAVRPDSGPTREGVGFASAMVRGSRAAVTGSLLLGLAGLVTSILGVAMPWVFGGLAVILAVYACFFAWREEYRKRLAAEKRIAALEGRLDLDSLWIGVSTAGYGAARDEECRRQIAALAARVAELEAGKGEKS